MTMLITNPVPASIPDVPVATEVNYKSHQNRPASLTSKRSCSTSRLRRLRLNLKNSPIKSRSHATGRVLSSERELEPELEPELELEETPLAECRKCQRVATHLDLCYLHWQEHVSYAAFQPDVIGAVAAYHLVEASHQVVSSYVKYR